MVLLEAVLDEKPLAYLMAFRQLHERAWYFYGASDDEMRNLMPTLFTAMGGYALG